MEANRSQEWLDAISNAKKYVSEQIVMGTDTSLEELDVPMEPGIKFPFIPRTSEKFDGFRPREMTTFIAPPNVGKSSLMRQMKYRSVCQHERDCWRVLFGGRDQENKTVDPCVSLRDATEQVPQESGLG